LVEAFKSTLEQTLDAELLLHVCDAGHRRVDEQIHAVDAVLDEIGAGDLPRLLVLNKVDVTDGATVRQLARTHPDSVAVSARTGAGIDGLVSAITSRLTSTRRVVEALVPYEHADLVALAHRDGTVLKEEHRPDGTYVVAQLEGATAATLEPFALVSGWTRGSDDS
jgi:GTP-binding protein HflX